MGRRGTAAAESFALLMQGIAQGIHGLRQKQAQESDDARAERRLQMEEEHFRGLQEERQLNRQERVRHNLEQERLRQEAIDKARKEDEKMRRMQYILGAEFAGKSGPERQSYMEFIDQTDPDRERGLDDAAIIDKVSKPGVQTFDYGGNATLQMRLATLNKTRRSLGLPDITPSGDTLTLSHQGVKDLRATSDVLQDWRADNEELDRAIARTRPKIESLGIGGKEMSLDRLRGLLRRAREYDAMQRGVAQSSQAEQPVPTAAGVPELREAQNRDGNLIRNRTDRMVGALLGGEMGGMEGQVPSAPMARASQLAGVFSTDPMQRLSNWMELHTAGYPLMPPTLDMAVDAATGVPQLKPEYFAMMEQTQPGMGQAANQMLQSMASVQQRNQQQFGPQGAGRDEAGRSRGQGGYLQGQFPLGGSPGERAASRASQSRPAPTQASPMIPQGRTPQPGPFNPMFGVGR